MITSNATFHQNNSISSITIFQHTNINSLLDYLVYVILLWWLDYKHVRSDDIFVVMIR